MTLLLDYKCKAPLCAANIGKLFSRFSAGIVDLSSLISFYDIPYNNLTHEALFHG